MSITIRPMNSIEEFKECVRLQEATWGEGFSERVPPAILNVGQRLGGVSSGAYNADGELVGFVFGLTGLRDGELVHWSDMLAVRPGLRDSGLGRRLKSYQRDEVLSRGVRRMHWTFDPLQARNAHLNLTRLGAVIREYEENMYGDTDSPLHAGIGTDRFIALWQLDSERVDQRLSASGPEPWAADGSEAPAALAADADGRHPTPSAPSVRPGNDRVRIAIPSDVGAIMEDDLPLAVAWRHATRAAFSHYLNAGYEVCEFQRGDRVSEYLLARIEMKG